MGDDSPVWAAAWSEEKRKKREKGGKRKEIEDYISILFASAGTPFCPTCSVEIKRQSVSQISDEVSKLKGEFLILGPVIRGKKGEHRAVLDEAVAAAHRGEFHVLLVWALDRLDRESPTGPFEIMRRFKSAGCDVMSLTETWASTDGPFADLMTLVVGWFANFESVRRSERIRAGLARRKAEGLPVGRQPGAKDRKKRKRSGYVARWENRED